MKKSQSIKSTKELPRPRTDRKTRLFIGVAIGIFIMAIPFLFYSYRLIPTTMEETTILGLTIKAGAHGNLNYFAYYFFTKLVIFTAFVLWFLTCTHWWRFALLVPICMFVFQMLGIVNTSIDYIDEFDFWYSLPIVLPIALILYFISSKMNRYRNYLDIKEEIETEINNAQE